MKKHDYPQTKRLLISEEHFGREVADPYRWLESDVRTDAEVAGWIETQNAATQKHLSLLPGREEFRSLLTKLYDHERFDLPSKRGSRYFFTRNAGLQNQSTLNVRESVHGPDRILIDPNGWAEDGTMALSVWSASHDGCHVAYAVQEAGSDWCMIHVVDVESGKLLPDSIAWARFGQIAWVWDGSGFFYSRFPEPERDGVFQASVTDHAVYFHHLGTPQQDDRCIHATPDQPNLLHIADVTDDGRYAVIYSLPGAGMNALAVIDLANADWTPRQLVEGFDHQWSVVGALGTRLLLLTDEGAPNSRIVAIEADGSGEGPIEVVAEDGAVLSSASILGGRIVATYLVDAKTEVRVFTLAGIRDDVVDLPGIGTAGGFRADSGDHEAFYVFTSYNAPTTIYRYDVASGTSEVWAMPKAEIDLDRIVVEQHFFDSVDGTGVPMFIVRRRDITTPAPTLLYGYGGFSISMVPYYAPDFLAWVEQGGIVAVANIRGGGEYGKAWHEAGRGKNKQNVFDDFISAARYLRESGLTSQDGLAIQGGSNGGLLVGAVVNQQPELFDVALPGVGVMDMVRFAKFTGGTFWVQEFGDPSNEEDFRNLIGYSPYHSVAAGRRYPAVLATTADTDDRVVPGHTFKYVAALQSADLGPKPRLLRVDTRAGHGGGKPVSKLIEELADMWTFAAQWTGLTGRSV